MYTTQHQDTLPAKQRLRTEINTHIEDFLHKGGRIEVVVELSAHNRTVRLGHKQAAAELPVIPDLYGD